LQSEEAKDNEQKCGESGEDGHVSEVGIPISPLTGRRSRSKQGTVFSVQAENISRMFGDGAREHIAMATSNASVSARDPIPRVLATEFGASVERYFGGSEGGDSERCFGLSVFRRPKIGGRISENS
jgi:hypothetical protein